MASSASQPKSAGSFFSLPAEVRNKIYDYVLANGNPIDTTSKPRRPSPQSKKTTKPSRSALPNACRQTYNESSSIFYENSAFIIRSQDLQPFIRDIPPAHLQCIQDLTLDRRGAHWQGAMHPTNPHGLAPLSAFRNLRRLQMTLQTPVCWDQEIVDLARFIEPQPLDDPLEMLRRAVTLLPRLEALALFSRVDESEVPFLVQRGVEMGPWRWSGWTYVIEHVEHEERVKARVRGLDGNIVEVIKRK